MPHRFRCLGVVARDLLPRDRWRIFLLQEARVDVLPLCCRVLLDDPSQVLEAGI